MQLRRGFAAASSRQVNAGAVVFALAALLAGCSGPSADKRLSSGQAHLERGDVRAAMIEAKAALQAQPESAAGRLLLARTLLAVGDLPGAEIELRRAERFGLAPAVAAPHAARLALAQGKPEVARQRLRAPEVSSAGAALDAEALTLLAQAERTLGNTAAAQAAVDQALAAAPANVPALALRVRLMADRGDVPAALAQLRMHTTLHPAAAELWQLSGELLGRDDARLADAAAALQKAVALDTRRGEAHAALVMVRLRQRDLAAAKAQAAELRKVLPGLPLADYLEGLVAFLSGDLPLARERMSMLMKSTEPQPQTLLLAGMVHARLADTAQAEAYFTAALTAAPAWAPPRRELAALHLRQGRPERALAILEPLLTPKRSGSDAEPAGADDADLWLLAGQAHARRADFRAADTAYARAKRLRPADAAVRKAMAKLDLARGDIDAGLRELQAVAAAERDDVGADLALISALMQRGERAAALKALQSAMAKRPVLALLPYLRGRILEEAAQVADARVAYEEALAREARFRPAIDALAALDLAERQPAKARQRYEALLKAEPNSAPTLLAMGELALRSGARVGEVNDWIDRSVRADPKDAGNWRAAVDLQRRLGDPTATLSRAQTAHAALPDDGELMLALADAQQFGGEAHQSVATLNRLLQRQPNSAQVQLRLALAYGLAAQPDAARAPLARALQLAPESPEVQRAAIRLALADRQVDRARALAATAQQRQPKQPLGWVFEGEIETALGRPAAAAAAYRMAHERSRTSESAVQLHRSLAASDAAAAAAFARQQLAAAPGDAHFLTHLAEAAAAQGRAAEAETRYRQVLKLQPDHVVALNNLAELLNARRDPQALVLAKRAAEVAPHLAAVLDTLATAHAALGQPKQAAEVQVRAVELRPREPLLRLHLARYLVAQGEKNKAASELRWLAQAIGPASPLRAEVDALLRQAGG